MQDKIIELCSRLRIRYLIQLLKYPKVILEAFYFENTENFNLISILENIRVGLENINLSEEERKLIIKTLDGSCLKDETYSRLKNSLLEVFIFHKGQFDNEILVSILIFILKSLQLKWPLNKSQSSKYSSLDREFCENPKCQFIPSQQKDDYLENNIEAIGEIETKIKDLHAELISKIVEFLNSEDVQAAVDGLNVNEKRLLKPL